MTACYGCAAELEPVSRLDETDYQFQNALWVTLDGGYGMFIESESLFLHSDFWLELEEGRRQSLFDQWVGSLTHRNESGEWDDTLTGLHGPAHPDDVLATPMPLPEQVRDEWRSWYEANRRYKVVICHECAHYLCSVAPWLGRLIRPETSHTHKREYLDAHPNHKDPS